MRERIRERDPAPCGAHLSADGSPYLSAESARCSEKQVEPRIAYSLSELLAGKKNGPRGFELPLELPLEDHDLFLHHLVEPYSPVGGKRARRGEARNSQARRADDRVRRFDPRSWNLGDRLHYIQGLYSRNRLRSAICAQGFCNLSAISLDWERKNPSQLAVTRSSLEKLEMSPWQQDLGMSPGRFLRAYADAA